MGVRHLVQIVTLHFPLRKFDLFCLFNAYCLYCLDSSLKIVFKWKKDHWLTREINCRLHISRRNEVRMSGGDLLWVLWWNVMRGYDSSLIHQWPWRHMLLVKSMIWCVRQQTSLFGPVLLESDPDSELVRLGGWKATCLMKLIVPIVIMTLLLPYKTRFPANFQ